MKGDKPGRSLSSQTVANAVRTLSRALADAVDDDLIQMNPALGAWKVRADLKAEMSVWTPADARTFLKAPKRTDSQRCGGSQSLPEHGVVSSVAWNGRLLRCSLTAQDRKGTRSR